MKLHSLKQNKALKGAAVNPDEIKKSLRTKSPFKRNEDISPVITGLLRLQKAKRPALKKTKTSLLKSGEESRFLAENISEPVWVFNPTPGQFSEATPVLFHSKVISKEDLTNKIFSEILTPASAQMILKEITANLPDFKMLKWDCFVNQSQQTFEDGTLRCVETSSKFTYGKDGNSKRVRDLLSGHLSR